MIVHFCDDAFLYVWKPHGVPSTFGKQSSFLESIVDMQFFAEQKNRFSLQEEYGLVNRLDNDTAGLLYFARTQAVYNLYLHAQDNEGVVKHYVAAIA